MRLPSQWFLLRELVKRDFQGRYAGSVLGFLWSFVQPLWQLALFWFVFSQVMRISPLGERTESFPIFLFCGLLPWMAVHEGLLRSATAVTDNAHLVKKLRFPSEVLVLAVVLAALLHEAVAGAVFAGVLLLTGELRWSGLPLLALALPLQLGLTLGLGLLLASLNVFVRDIAQVLGMLLTAWFYLTPIVYPLAMVPDRLRTWIELNPLSALVGLYRRAFLGGGSVDGVLPLMALSAVVLAVGLIAFRALRPAFADEI